MSGNQSIFKKASAWCQSPEPRKPARASDILCQPRATKSVEQEEAKTFGEPIFVQNSFQILSRMIDQETDETTLECEIHGFGTPWPRRCSSVLVPYVTHASEDVRYAVTRCSSVTSSDGIRFLLLASPVRLRSVRRRESDLEDWGTGGLYRRSLHPFPPPSSHPKHRRPKY
jgi:hypothetical protein